MTDTDSQYSFAPDKNENAFVSLLFNIALPVLLLNKLTGFLTENIGDHGPTLALVIALAFPTGYGLYDYLKRKKKNMISILGFFNILMTGGLALLQTEGIWFAVKEAAFPLLIGVFVWLSTYGKKPFIELFIYNDKLLNLPLIEERLEEKQNQSRLHQHLKQSTYFLAGSFLLSAILNFVLARFIFVDSPAALSAVEKASVLNEQIAEMTWLSWIVIVIPSMICMFAILWHLFAGIHKLTGLKMNEIIKQA